MKNEPAFPCHGSMGEVTNDGMTLRDYFAAKAVEGFIAYASHKGIYTPPDDELASAAYQLADAMLKAREA